MKYLRISILFLTLTTQLWAEPSLKPTAKYLIPQPKSLSILSGTFDLDKGLTLSVDAGFQKEGQLLSDSLKSIKLSVEKSTSAGNIQLRKFDVADTLFRDFQQWGQHSAEAYMIALRPERIVITANDPSGMFYGIQTLLELIRLQGKRLQAMDISDAPDFKLRGISDDISRGQVSTMKNFKKIIRFLARYKMNVYMPYIEDTYRFKSMPDIGKGRGALSAKEWQELQDYAAPYHIEVIPAFQTLGHYENILYDSEYHGLAEFPGAGSLRVLNDSTYAFLDKALNEVCQTFKSTYFNMGADESWDVGKFETKRITDRHGLATIHARHYKQVYDLLRAKNKKVMMYGDIVLRHPGILAQIPKDITMMDWHYYPRLNYPSTETFANAGQPFIVSPGIHNWRKLFPNFTDALANMQGMAIDGLRNGASGYITSNWGDYGGMNLRELGYYAYAYAGAVAWNIAGTTTSDFDQAFFPSFFGDTNPGYGLIYQMLSQIAPRAEWLTMVGHPFYPLKKDGIKEQRFSVELPLARAHINQMLDGLNPTRNSSQIDYLRLCSNFYGWYGDLQGLKIEMARSAHNYDNVPPALLKKLSGKAIGLALDLNDLNKRYAKLWKRTNRVDNLQRLTGLWDRVSKELLIKADEIAEGNLSFNGALSTPFITLPGTEAKQAIPHIFMRRSFNFKGKQSKAYLQLIANTNAVIWLNDKRIGRVWARKSLSSLVEAGRVKSWEVGRYLKSGQNVIAVEVKNYTSGKASANVWLETIGSTPIRITTDRYWKVADTLFDDWQDIKFDDRAWPNGTDAQRNWLISRPYFKQGLSSRIEFYSGRGN